MGSHAYNWLACSYCERWGKCTPWYWDYTRDRWAPGFWDIDAVGVLCEPCFHRGCPPHADYMLTLFTLPSDAAWRIAAFACPVYAEYYGWGHPGGRWRGKRTPRSRRQGCCDGSPTHRFEEQEAWGWSSSDQRAKATRGGRGWSSSDWSCNYTSQAGKPNTNWWASSSSSSNKWK